MRAQRRGVVRRFVRMCFLALNSHLVFGFHRRCKVARVYLGFSRRVLLVTVVTDFYFVVLDALVKINSRRSFLYFLIKITSSVAIVTVLQLSWGVCRYHVRRK